MIDHWLVNRSEELCNKVCEQPLKFVLCHSDIHGGIASQAYGSKNSSEMYQQFLDMFASNGVVDMAFATDSQVN